MNTDNNTSAAAACGNCATPLKGLYCYRCGQPIKGLIRPLSGWVADFFDSVFDYDGRLPRTLIPLLFRPGFLTREYIAGRRVRYVTPVRLFLFLTIALFFALRLTTDFGLGEVTANLIPDEADMPRVERIVGWLPQSERDAVLEDIRSPPPPVDDSAAMRGAVIQIDGMDGQAEPLRIGWLSDGMNGQLNTALRQMNANLQRINQDPRRFLEQILSVAPQTLFFTLPIFALLLKLFYVFKRRLYLEHLLVALHSHSFIAFTLLLMIGANALATAVENTHWLAGTFEAIGAVLLCWIPVNLFLTQKRVYGQGWVSTTLKFVMIGLLYLILLTFVSLVTLLLSLLLW